MYSKAHVGLRLKSTSEIDEMVSGFVDFDYARSIETRKSFTGFILPFVVLL